MSRSNGPKSVLRLVIHTTKQEKQAEKGHAEMWKCKSYNSNVQVWTRKTKSKKYICSDGDGALWITGKRCIRDVDMAKVPEEVLPRLLLRPPFAERGRLAGCWRVQAEDVDIF
jgi:hypothetical protein